MIEVKAPNCYNKHKDKISFFLAGSIEQGKAEDWQSQISTALQDQDNVLLLNPRREHWDASWEQSIDNPQFKEQVEWELDAMRDADFIVMYYCPGTKSPVTLMEFGLYAKNNPEKLLVCCPKGFWRKGNVDIVCQKYGVRQVDTIDGLVAFIREHAQQAAEITSVA